METQNEKKWFIYLLDHHEGPFSVSDIESLVQEKKASEAYYVWCEGMPDWEVMSSVEAFKRISENTPPPPPNDSPAVEVASAIEKGELEEKKETQEPLESPQLEEAEPLEPLEAAEVVEVEEQSLPVDEPTPQVEATPVLPEQVDEASLKIDTGALPETETAAYVAPTDTTNPAIEKKRFFLFRPFFILLMFFIGVAVASGYGLLDPVWTHPQVKPHVEKIKPVFSQVTPLFNDAKNWVVNKVPYLQTWISSVPDVNVSANDKENLKNALSSRFTGQNATLAIAMGLDNISSPQFFVSSNLPDKTVITVWLEGIPDTLMNRFEFSNLARVILADGFAKTTNMVTTKGQPLPKGKYRVIAFVPTAQQKQVKSIIDNLPTKSSDIAAIQKQQPKILAEQVYFIGGENDANYRSRLSDFQKKAREKAAKELQELRQFVGALQGQLDLSIARFGKLSQGTKTGAKKAGWRKFQRQWTKFNNHMNNQFKTWDGQKILQNVYYSDLYLKTKEVGMGVSQVFDAQNNYFNSKSKRLSLSSKQAIEAQAAKSELLLQSLKKALLQAGDPLKQTEGLPKRVVVEATGE